jgi:uncharacterized damage-inducible protein DinB
MTARVSPATIGSGQLERSANIDMRTRFLLIAGVFFPLHLHAQQRPTAQPPTDRVAQTFKAFGRPYGAWLVQAFDSIPASRFDYRPTPVQQSIGYIAQHLEDANYQLCARFGNASRVTTAKDSLADTVKARWPKDTLIARLRSSLVFCGEAIDKLTDARLADTLMAGSPGAQQPVTRARYLILLVTDLAEHYAQLAVYMRLLGLVPPSALPQPPR